MSARDAPGAGGLSNIVHIASAIACSCLVVTVVPLRHASAETPAQSLLGSAVQQPPSSSLPPTAAGSAWQSSLTLRVRANFERVQQYSSVAMVAQDPLEQQQKQQHCQLMTHYISTSNV